MEITIRLILYFWCNGATATIICMVEQFGLAMILSSRVSWWALISGIINFLVGSILQAEELSITVMPAAANLGAQSVDVCPPAEKMATAGLASIAVCMSTMVCSLPLNVMILPTERSLATGISSVTGKSRSSSICNIFRPTSPVAPTIAIFIRL